MQTNMFSCPVLALSVAAASFASCLRGEAAEPRASLLIGALLTALLCLASALTASAMQRSAGRLLRLLRIGFALWLALELAVTLIDAAAICWEEFSSLAVIGLLPLLLWAGWGLPNAVYNRAANVLWPIVLLGAGLCVLGLGSQLHWQNLYESGAAASGLSLPLCAEYFALPLLCGRAEQRKAFLLPAAAWTVQTLFALGIGMLFGPVDVGGLPGRELLRAWTLGAFSRFDGIFILLWLAAALYRICFLVRAIRLLADGLRTVAGSVEANL